MAGSGSRCDGDEKVSRNSRNNGSYEVAVELSLLVFLCDRGDIDYIIEDDL